MKNQLSRPHSLDRMALQKSALNKSCHEKSGFKVFIFSIPGVKQKEDLCNGVILDSFREKEIARQSAISVAISNLVSVLLRLIHSVHDQTSQFASECLSLSVEEEIDYFIDQEITNSAVMLDKENIRWTAKSVEVSWVASKHGIDAERAMAEFFATLSSSTELFSRNYSRRQDWNIHSKSSSPLNDLFAFLEQFMRDLSTLHLQYLSAVKTRIEPLINETIKCMETQNAASQKYISECNSDFIALETKLAKSVIECRRLETQIESLKQRIYEKEHKNKGKGKGKGKGSESKKKPTFKIFQKSSLAPFFHSPFVMNSHCRV